MVFLEHDWIIFPFFVGNVIIPSDEVIFFGGVVENHQAAQNGVMIPGLFEPVVTLGGDLNMAQIEASTKPCGTRWLRARSGD